jgi:translation initiation factor 1
MAEDFRDALRALLQNSDVAADNVDDTGSVSQPDESPRAAEQAFASVRLDIFFEKKGRGGKKATIVTGFPSEMDDDAIADLASQLKRKLGVGGSARGGEILIQGDRRNDLKNTLETLGWKSRIC